MAAVAFVANLTAQYQDGYTENIACTVSDVNAAFYLGQDGLSPINMSGGHGNGIIKDIILGPAGGTDTRTATIRVNGQLRPNIVLNSANLGNVIGRQFQQNPLRFPAGATLLFTQVT